MKWNEMKTKLLEMGIDVISKRKPQQELIGTLSCYHIDVIKWGMNYDLYIYNFEEDEIVQAEYNIPCYALIKLVSNFVEQNSL